MSAGRILVPALLATILIAAGSGRRWAIYEHEMQNPAEDPPDAWEKTEFAFARLRFRSNRDGYWRAVLGNQNRVQVAICFNMDLGDAWEWADYPEYPERFSAMAYRIGVNYVLYALTH